MFEEIFKTLFRPVIERLDRIMATAEELQQQVQDVKTSLQQAIDRVQADVDNLKDQLGEGIDPDSLDPISQGLADLKASLDQLDPDPENPPQPVG